VDLTVWKNKEASPYALKSAGDERLDPLTRGHLRAARGMTGGRGDRKKLKKHLKNVKL